MGVFGISLNALRSFGEVLKVTNLFTICGRLNRLKCMRGPLRFAPTELKRGRSSYIADEKAFSKAGIAWWLSVHISFRSAKRLSSNRTKQMTDPIWGLYH